MYRLFFSFFFFSLVAFSQVASVLEVDVVDEETGQKLQGAVIKFEELPLAGVTNQEGKFILKSIPPGEWRLICSFIGFKTERRVVLISGDRLNLQIAMKKDLVEIPEVIVSGTRAGDKGSSISFSNLTKLDIERLSITRDIPSILNTLPSTSYYSESGTGIGYGYVRIRGFDQRRISVLINGVPQNDPEDHSVYWINFYDLANSLEDVQVQRGSSISFYGPPAIGASINLVTNKPLVNPGVSFEVGKGSFNTTKYAFSANSGILADRFMIRVRGSRVTSDGYRDWSWSEFWRYFVSASYFDDVQTLSVNAYGGPQEDGLAFYGISKSSNGDEVSRKYNYGAASRDREVLNQPQVSLVHDINLGKDLWLKNTLFFLSGDGFFDFSANYGTNDYFRLDPSITIPGDVMMRAFVDNDQFGWLPSVEYRFTGGKLMAGGEIRLHRSLHWGRIESGTGLPADVVGEKGNRKFYEYKGAKNIYSAFVGVQSRLTERIDLVARVQSIYQQYRLYEEKYANNDFTTPYFFLNPQLGISFSLNDKISLYTSLSLTRREPPLKNLYEAESASWGVVPQFEKKQDGTYDYNNPLVKPESLLNIELGSRFAFSGINGSVNLYYMNFENEIVPSGGLDVFGQPRVGNAAKTLHYGLEFEGFARLPWGFVLNLNGNFSRNRFIDFTEYDSFGNPVSRNGNFIANAPEIILNGGLTYGSSHFHTSLSFNFTGAQYTDNSVNPDGAKVEEVTVDAFSVVNLSAGINYNLYGARLKFVLEINNLFDKKYLMNGFGWDNFFPAAGRNFMTTLKMEL